MPLGIDEREITSAVNGMLLAVAAALPACWVFVRRSRSVRKSHKLELDALLSTLPCSPIICGDHPETAEVSKGSSRAICNSAIVR